MGYFISGRTQQLAVNHGNLVVAFKVDPAGSPVFTKLAEVKAAADGKFTLTWENWGGRVLVVALDDDETAKLDCVAQDWLIPAVEQVPYSITNLTSLDSWSTAGQIISGGGISWSPDSRYIVVNDQDGNTNGPKLVEYDVATHAVRATVLMGIRQTYDICPSGDYNHIIQKPDVVDYHFRKITLTSPGTLVDGVTIGTQSSYQENCEGGIFMVPDETLIYGALRASDCITKQSLSTPGDPTTASRIQTSPYLDTLGLGTTDISGIHVTPDGLRLFVAQGQVISECTMSSPHDLSTLTPTGNSFTMPWGTQRFRFNKDGTRLACHGTARTLYIYDCSFP